ncbi:unnamed protein product [Brassica rapa subsp. narinosa]
MALTSGDNTKGDTLRLTTKNLSVTNLAHQLLTVPTYRMRPPLSTVLIPSVLYGAFVIKSTDSKMHFSFHKILTVQKLVASGSLFLDLSDFLYQKRYDTVKSLVCTSGCSRLRRFDKRTAKAEKVLEICIGTGPNMR